MRVSDLRERPPEPPTTPDRQPDPSVNSTLKLKLYPNARQKELLQQLFRVHRAVYNLIVADYRTKYTSA